LLIQNIQKNITILLKKDMARGRLSM